LVLRPNKKKPIGVKWIYKEKKNTKGEVERYKAWLVAKHYSQKQEINYNEVFALIDNICRTCAASRRSSSTLHGCGIWKIWRDKEFLSLSGGKIEWESPPSILVTRNPNWSQRSGTETGCVKGRY